MSKARRITSGLAAALFWVQGNLIAQTIKGGEITLEFASNGIPYSITRSDGMNLIEARNPGDGFYLQTGTRENAVKQRLSHLVYNDGTLIASVGPGEKPQITFAVSTGAKHIAFRIERIEGVPADRDSALYFDANLIRPVDMISLDYMTPMQWDARNKLQVKWPYLWHRSTNDPLGGFAFAVPLSDEDHDDTILEIWVDEKMPHPKIEGEWTLERARTWVREWQATFPRFDQLIIAAKKPEDLDTLLEFAKRLQVNRVYLHTDTWRGEYWPRTNDALHVNPTVFPGGEADLKAFIDKLKANGMGVVLHTVCHGFGASSRYVGEKPDKRLAFWGKGKLEQPVGLKDETIYFRPDPETENPLSIAITNALISYGDMWQLKEVRIGDELVRVGAFEETDQPVWRLTGCARGLYSTKAAAHEAGAEFIGLLKAYNLNFVPSSLTDLSEITASEYAEFFNRLGVSHHEFDGAEIHDDMPWGFDKWSQHVYENTDHPVTSNTSRGAPSRWNMEFRLSTSPGDLYESRGIASLFLHEDRRLATGPLENNFYLGWGAANGYRKFDFEKPEQMFGIAVDALSAHGLAGLFAEQFDSWRDLSQKLNDEQRKQILLDYYKDRNSDSIYFGGWHPSAKRLHEVVKTADGYEVRPFVVMSRGPADIDWRWTQEHGAVLPRQYMRPGQRLRLENPYGRQAPQFIIHVMNGFSQGATNRGGGAEAPDQDMKAYLSSAGADVGSESSTADGTFNNWIQPTAAQIHDTGDHEFTDDGAVLKIISSNASAAELVRKEGLPHFAVNADSRHARGVGLTVTGNDSGALLVVQVYQPWGAKDYVVPVDFTGRKEIVIPCGEASWADGQWGLRFSTKNNRYGPVNRVALGFGKVPANTRAEVKVENLRLLGEVASLLKDPVIHAAQGTLSIKGEVSSDRYLWYQGGDSVGVYDLNWNLVSTLPVVSQAYAVETGFSEFWIEHEGNGVHPWLDVQFIAKGEAFTVNP